MAAFAPVTLVSFLRRSDFVLSNRFILEKTADVKPTVVILMRCTDRRLHSVLRSRQNVMRVISERRRRASFLAYRCFNQH